MAETTEPRGTIMLRTHSALHIAAGVFGLTLVISMFRGDTAVAMVAAFLGFLCIVVSAALAVLCLLIVSQLGLFESFVHGPPQPPQVAGPPPACDCPADPEAIFDPECGEDDDDDD